MHIKALLVAVGMCVAPILVQAQNTHLRLPVITMGRIHATEIKNGKMIPTPTTRQEILQNALLLADVNNCQVTEYRFSIISPGQHYYGPVYVNGGELTDSLKNKIKQQNGPNVKIFIEGIKVNYRGNEMDVKGVALKYDE